MSKNRKSLIISLAALYACAMIYLLLWRQPSRSGLPYLRQLSQHLNLMPFHTIRKFIWVITHSTSPRLLRQASMNLFGNILLFLPLGFFPPLLWKGMQKFWKSAALAAGIMICIEALQMLLLVGTCDVDDIILNVLGASLGYGFYHLLRPKTE